MLVPASGITLSAARSGSNVSISFPTQAGAAYRVFYRADLPTGNWILLATVLGDGTVKSVSDSTTGSQRFYKVTSP
jgi:cell division inhibitor SulA